MGDPSFAEQEDRISTIVELDPGAPPFELDAGPYARRALSVLSFRGREAISKPFSFEITVAASTEVDDASIEADLIGKPACLTMLADESGPRRVRGVITTVQAQGVVQRGRHTYRVRLVPRLWLLKQRKTSRILQDQTVQTIVSAVLDEAGVPHAWRLLGTYRLRTYCVQYQETDLAFVSRLLAEEGLFYFFAHGDGEATRETVMLCDNAHMYPAIEGDPELLFRGSEGSEGLLPSEHHVPRFTRTRTLKPSSVLRRGYDFRRPVLDLTATATATATLGFADASDEPEPELLSAEIYEHHCEDEQTTIADGTVLAELEQHRRQAAVAEGMSGCRRLLPGFRFDLDDHPIDRLNQAYAITHIEHDGVAPEVAKHGEAIYANRFACVPAEVTARPARPVRNLQQTMESAVVVGPEGQEIYTDDYGRVKVQFPWDREGARDERSSCWMRVSQAWAGPGFGFQFIPRIGMEVVVTFLGGDVDRPLITGCVPNAINRVPFSLPASQTRSGIRTRSTPRGEGANELSFEDGNGHEQIYFHAQRDLDEVIEHDHSVLVKADETTQVFGNRGDTTLGDRREAVRGHADLRFAGDRCTQIGGRERCEVAGAADFNAKSDVTVRVRGCHTTLVGTAKAKRSYVLHVEGITQLSSSGLTEIRSDKELVFRCGKSSLRITEERIEITSPSISMTGTGGGLTIDEAMTIRAKKDAYLFAEKMLLKSSSASVSLGTDAQIDGKKILLNSPASAADPVSDPTPELTRIELVNQIGKPLAHQRYLVTLADGAEVSGVLDKDGRAALTLEGTGTISFPELRSAQAV